jgi:hypothetical protein
MTYGLQQWLHGWLYGCMAVWLAQQCVKQLKADTMNPAAAVCEAVQH